MSVIVFCGPTLPASDRAGYAGFDFRPPVRQGDVYAATLDRPAAIGIMDGFFDGMPAVWHKEILWALSSRIAVFGASSMGALRAAELCSFGMRGVGRIFQDFRDGRLEDDDEVALIHGPAETGYIALSEPMVNVRATLARAILEQQVDAATAAGVAALAKAQFYQERTWEGVVDAARREFGAALDPFAAWLPEGKVDQKRDDAIELLRALDAFDKEGTREPPPAFAFEWTENWANAAWRREPRAHQGALEREGEAVLDELRLQSRAYAETRRAALLRALAAREGLEAERSEIARQTMAFRLSRGLSRQSDVHRWAADHDFDASRFELMMAGQARVETLSRAEDPNLHAFMLDELRCNGNYLSLRSRAQAKARQLAKADAQGGAVAPAVLVAWYFTRRLGTAIPDDMAHYAAGLGFDTVDAFYELLVDEYRMAAAEALGTGRD